MGTLQRRYRSRYLFRRLLGLLQHIGKLHPPIPELKCKVQNREGEAHDTQGDEKKAYRFEPVWHRMSPFSADSGAPVGKA